MAIDHGVRAKPSLLNKKELQRLMDQVEARLEVENGPVLPAPEVRALMIAEGVRPEDRIATRELIQMRYPDESRE